MDKPQQPKPLNDLSRSLTPLDVNHTLICVIEMGTESWLVGGIIPGVERQPLKKLKPNENELLKLFDRWRQEAEKAGHKINRITVAFEAGRDGFWLARWLRARGIEAHVIHAASVAVSREHRRAKTDRLDTQQLKRAFWAGCAASGTTARCARSRPSQRKMPDAPTASAIPSLASTLLSSTASRRPWRGLAFAASIPSSKRRQSAWSICAHPRASPFRPTRSPN